MSGTTGRWPSSCSSLRLKEKTLYANLGGHTGVPQFEGEEGTRFFTRRLGPGSTAPPDL